MKPLIAFFAGNRVAADLLMAFIFAAGLLSIPAIRKELTPPRLLNTVEISSRRSEPALSGSDAWRTGCGA